MLTAQSNYTLEVISHHPQFKNKSLRKYAIDGIETVGAWGDEPFEIRFKNNTWQKVQVKISLDGTDVYTGETATTDVTSNMWVVQPYDTMSLKAWPETNNGGAAFIFTSANNSVAVHTHGDLSHRGIIAAAVYVEGHVEPIRVNPNHYYNSPYNYDISWGTTQGTSRADRLGGSGYNIGGGGTYSSSIMPQGHVNNNSANVMKSDNRGRMLTDNFNLISGDACAANAENNTLGELETLVSVGAGHHVDQKITYVTGLIKPTLSETVRVKYLWWDDLVAKLKESSAPSPHPSGFPQDRKNIDLKNTPRKSGSFRRSPNPIFQYQRV